MQFLQQIWLCYLKPKRFEYTHMGTIYDYIGIKWYKKYLPTTGDIARRWNGVKQIDLGKNNRVAALYAYEQKTRIYEGRHIAGTIGFVLLIFLTDRQLTLYEWIFLFLLNLLVNIYPVFLQRYNRIRILQTLKNMGQPCPYVVANEGG